MRRIALARLVAASWLACGSLACAREDVAPPPEQALPDPGLGAIRVEAGTARLGRIDRPLTATGMTAPWREANLRAEVGGRVLALEVDNGDLVAPGDRLLEVDGSRQRIAISGAGARIDALEQDLEFARDDLERKQGLFAKGSLPKVQLDASQLLVDRAESAIAGARIELGAARRSSKDTHVEAPIAGVVARRLVDLGDTIGPGAPLLDIVDLAKIRVRIGLSGSEIGRLDQQAPAELRIEDLGGEVVVGSFAAAAPSADPITGLFDVEYHVDNAKGSIRGGMVVTGVLPLRSAVERVLVPRAALTRRGGELVVFVLEPLEPGGTASDPTSGMLRRVARERVVRTGSYGPSEVEVLEGLAAGALVACSGQHALAEGVLVEFEP